MSEGVNISNEIIIAPGVDLGPDFFQITPFRTAIDLGNDIIIIEPISIDFYTTTPYQWAVNNGYNGTQEEFILDWLNSLNGQSVSGVFNDATPTDITVGALLENSIINNKTWQEIIALMVYQEKFPTLVNPSFLVSSINGNIFEINNNVTIQFLLNYNMGSIIPAYGTNGFRSGNIVKYMLGIQNIPYQSLSQQYNYSVNIQSPATITYPFYAERLIGPQPKSNKGNNYNVPYPAGDLTYYFTVYYVYPIYATFVTIDITSKMILQRFDSEYFEVTMIAEDNLNNKQCIELSYNHRNITGIKQLNTFSNIWEWINGSQIQSLQTFTKTIITKTVNSVNISYIQYKHNGPKIGERKLRFYTT